MNTRMFIKINSLNEDIPIRGYRILESEVCLIYDNPVEKSEGFSIYEGDNLIFDGTDYKYRWDVADQKPNEIWYTNNPNNTQTEPWSVISKDAVEYPDPLTNEELTECVADLMYETILMKLGLEV